MYPLPAEEKIELIAGLTEAPSGDIRNYEDWLLQQYGTPIAERWPLPYTEKYWTVPASALGTDWIGQRVRRADVREVLQGALTTAKPNHFYAKEMRYPEKGGYRSFIEPLIEDAEIRCNQRVAAINPDRRTVHFEDGTEISYGRIVSSLPLPKMADYIVNVPEDVSEAAATLFATQVDLVSVGFNRSGISPALWFYIYDRDIAAARAYSPDWKSPDNVPAGCSSLQFEIYSSVRNPQRMDADEMKRNTVQALEKMGLAKPEDIAVIDHRRLPYGNVVFDVGMEERRDSVRNWVEAQGIRCAGRFGEWDYLWSNQSMISGMRAAESAFT
jgi:protoporphyrinogen oxidase